MIQKSGVARDYYYDFQHSLVWEKATNCIQTLQVYKENVEKSKRVKPAACPASRKEISVVK